MPFISSIATTLGFVKSGQQIIEAVKDVVETEKPSEPVHVPPPSLEKVDPIEAFEVHDHYEDGYKLGYKTQNPLRFESKLKEKRSHYQYLHLQRIEELRERLQHIHAQKQKQGGMPNFNADYFNNQTTEITRLIQKNTDEIAKSEENEGRFKRIYTAFNDGFVQGVGDWNDENSFFNRL